MTEKEIQEILDELNTVRPEMLNENAKRLFEAIMQIADKKDELQQRVNKAIKYVNNNSLYEQESDYDNEDNLILGIPSDEKATNDLLDILKGNDNPSFEEMVNFLENNYKDLKNQPTLHEELEEERKRIAKIVDNFKKGMINNVRNTD